ncbi:MAG TPA: NADH-quinone oxidoreductase subunit NuoH [Anaerolineales bacterium]|nr:NADH-quinone oxidoreductase subunit NuoH [Anaerolineales bacterium]
MNEVTVIIIDAAIKAAVMALVLLTGFAYMTYAERKVIAGIQVRRGPNRIGPLGLLQPAADGVKLFLKEDMMPTGADKLMFNLAPIITSIPALVIMAVIPVAPDWIVNGYTVRFVVADLNVGVLYLLAIGSIAVYGIVLAGWASDSKYSMMGGLRSTAQVISYELAFGLSMVGPMLLAQSMSLRDIVHAQEARGIWFMFLQPIGFLLFFITGLAELNRAPFDMPEAEQELTAGYFTEYSSMRFGMFFMAEYIKMIAVSGMVVTLYMGGYLGPFVNQFPPLGIAYFSAKVFFLLFTMIWIRGTLPRLRYDQLMSFGWKFALPVAMLNVLATAIVLVYVM